MPGFGALALIVAAGLLGPLLSSSRRWFVPVVVGEIAGGILAGPQVLAAIAPSSAVLSFLGEAGFAMLMLTAGMHLPLHDRRLAGSLRAGALQAGAVFSLGAPAGLLAAALAGGGHAAIYAVVLASGSAAVLLPAFEEAGLSSETALRVMAQVAIADVLTIVAVPVVLQPGRVGHAALGALLVALAAAALLLAARAVGRVGWAQAARRRSKQRHWALDLRLALLILFGLAWLAQQGGTSILIAGFGAGVVIAMLGGPKRLSTQVRGVADGFFIPLYFVVLGARLDVGGLFGDASMLGLAAVLLVLGVAIRLLAAALARGTAVGALAADAQLGVPAAVASIGLAQHLLSPVAATAIVASALLSLAVATAGIDLLIRREGGPPGGSARADRPAAGERA